jgi:hypothetical protein
MVTMILFSYDCPVVEGSWLLHPSFLKVTTEKIEKAEKLGYKINNTHA